MENNNKNRAVANEQNKNAAEKKKGLWYSSDTFELPSDVYGIVGIWKCVEAESGIELWSFNADGSFRLADTDEDGKQHGSGLKGQYRINGSELVITIDNIASLWYTFELDDVYLKLYDHGCETLLEPFSGNITLA